MESADAATRPAGARARLSAGLAFRHPDARLAAAVEAAKLRLVDDAPGAPESRTLRALGALAAGAFDLARTDGHASGDAPEASSALTHAFLVGRYHAWSGDAAGVGMALSAALAAVEGARGDSTSRLIARDLLSLAEALGDSDASPRLRRAMQGVAPDAPAASWLAAMSAPDAGREVLRTFLEGDPGSAATWERLALAASPWTLPLLVTGLLGAEPNAARGRLRLRTHLPAHWESWGVHRLRMADAVVDLSVRRTRDAIEIAVEQTGGMLPATVLLEPIVHSQPATMEVDGRTASLLPRRIRGYLVVPVQLVLEQPRALTIGFAPGST